MTAGRIAVTASIAAGLLLAALFVATSLSLTGPDVDAGRRLYVDGVLPDGSPVQARVLGDVPVSGAQAQCASCHGRHGLGTNEGDIRSREVAGRILFDPDRFGRGLRPGYTRETFARAMREGIGSDGGQLDLMMPVYPDLSDEMLDALIAYLHTIGADDEPGQNDEEVLWATVVSSDVPDDQRAAILETVGTFVRIHNEESRNAVSRRRGPNQIIRVERPWRLLTWEVEGDPTSWRRQLERHYRREAVFGLVSGFVGDEPWQPVHDFCDELGLPCFLPITDEPPAETTAGFTLYYSGGLPLEGRVLATELPEDGIVQVVPRGDPKASRAADALERALAARGKRADRVSVHAGDGSALAAALARATRAAVSWMDPVEGLPTDGVPIYVSTTFSDPDALPEAIRSRTWVLSRRLRSGVRDDGMARFEVWARPRGLEVTHRALQAQAWYAALAAQTALPRLALSANRRYTIDALDHLDLFGGLAPIYARGSMSPYQRTISKGAWLWRADEPDEARYVVP